jgi:hypothetical protein
MSDQVPTPLAEIAEHFASIATQDNACTAHPIFLVQERERILGMDPEYGDDNYVWMNAECDNWIADGDLVDKLEELDHDHCYGEQAEIDSDPEYWDDGEGDPIVWDQWEKVFYIDKWVTRQAFFTRKGAEQHERDMAHNYRGETRVYVDSLYRNHEMQLVSELLERLVALDDVGLTVVEWFLGREDL